MKKQQKNKKKPIKQSFIINHLSAKLIVQSPVQGHFQGQVQDQIEGQGQILGNYGSMSLKIYRSLTTRIQASNQSINQAVQVNIKDLMMCIIIVQCNFCIFCFQIQSRFSNC